MQRKTIVKTLDTKFKNWLESIEDKNVKELVRKNTIITGGCITSMFLGEDVNDFDIYFTDRKTVVAVANYYVNKFNKINGNKIAVLTNRENYKRLKDSEENEEESDSSNILGKSDPLPKEKESTTEFNVEDEMEKEEGDVKIFISSSGVAGKKLKTKHKKEKFIPLMLTDNSITLSDEIQVIIRFWGDAKEIHKNFDFVHCTNYWTSKNKKLYTNAEALECILSRTLMYRGSQYPLCSIIRSRKFIKRGWKINAGQYLKMVMQLNELDLHDIDVLREQLIGVDVSYFEQLISSLESKQKLESQYSESDLKPGIDTNHVIELINKIFDDEGEDENEE